VDEVCAISRSALRFSLCRVKSKRPRLQHNIEFVNKQMIVKENIECKFLISKAGALRLTRRSGRELSPA